MIAMTAALAGCAKKQEEAPEPTPEPKAEITVSFYNDKTLLGQVKAIEGEALTGWEQYGQIDGYQFDGWFETPTFLEASRKDPAKDTFTEDTNLYGSFKKLNVTEDKRKWTIVGAGSSPVLAKSNWNNNCQNSDVKFQLTGNEKNEFSLTLDLFTGDKFQIIHDFDWVDQRGYGWFTDLDADCFENGGGLSGSSKSSDIQVKKDGNYTITMVTDPDNSNNDKFTITRNGDAAAAPAEN